MGVIMPSLLENSRWISTGLFIELTLASRSMSVAVDSETGEELAS